MIELQIINRILDNGNLNFLTDNNLKANDFSEAYRNEVQYIVEHNNNYNKVPDAFTFIGEFDDFDIIEVNESDKYLSNKFYESLVYRIQIDIAKEWGELLGDPDATQAFEYLKKRVEELKNLQLKKTVGTDLTKDIDRLTQHVRVVTEEGATGLLTGIEPLDDEINAILDDDLVVIAARTNMGKSFISQKILVNMWKQGKKILMYSGENSATTIGYRFDTLYKHYNNTALRFGKDKEGETIELSGYTQYWDRLMGEKTPFIVITPKDLNGDRLDVPGMKALVDKYDPDIICLDQLSLMSDYRAKRNDNERMAYSHIMQDLRLFVDEYSKPVIVVSQTSRNSAITEDGVYEPPRIEDLSESDGVGTNAKKVITFAVNGDILHVIIRKNTDGAVGGTFKMLWNINKGIFLPFTEPSYDNDEEEQPIDSSGTNVF